MTVIVNIPFHATRAYIDEFDEETIPNVGDAFDDIYVVARKTINENVCTLDLQKSDHIIKE